MANRRSRRSTLFQVKWQIGNREFLRQVHGEKQKQRLESTLAALPWVSNQEVIQLRR